MEGGNVQGRLPAIGRVLLVCAVATSACDSTSDDGYSSFGFNAYYERPIVDPHSRCGFPTQGPQQSDWIDGPHERFAEIGPARLASDSLRWFERSMQSAVWYGNPTARLELTYPSADLTIHASLDPSAGLTWEEQLHEWFQRFPPSCATEPDGHDSWISWEIEFGKLSSVRGTAPSEAEAVQTMHALHAAHGTSPLFAPTNFRLTYAEQRSSHETDSYSVEVSTPEELDLLPTRLAEKRARWARRTARAD
jgi:hypothetical protein